MRLLITRPEPDGARSAEAFRARGHEVLLAPLIHIEPVSADLGGAWAAVVITSANALIGFADDARLQALTRLPLVAVGDRSAAAARQAGFAEVTSAGGSAQDLIRLLPSLPVASGRPLLYLAGADRAADLATELAAAGLNIDTRVVYRAAPLRQFPERASSALAAGRIDGVLHYSRRAAEAYVALASGRLGDAALRPAQFCLSARIAEALTAAGAADVRAAAYPTEQSLLQLVDSR